MGILHEYQYTFFIISCSNLLQMVNVLENIIETIKTLILCSITFFRTCAIYEIMWKNIVEMGRPQMTVWCMHIACWIPEATNTHSDYVILIAFPL